MPPWFFCNSCFGASPRTLSEGLRLAIECLKDLYSLFAVGSSESFVRKRGSMSSLNCFNIYFFGGRFFGM